MNEAPDLASPVAGWRVWRLESGVDGPRLVSPYTHAEWPHRAATTASCRLGCERAPSPGCRCGLYALADIEHLPRAVQRRGPVVAGCTALWGQVVEHAHGWRGELGYPLLLVTVPDPWQALSSRDEDDPVRRSLVDRYGVPVYRAPLSFRRLGVDINHHAAAVRDEAARGLAARRLGDQVARQRLHRIVETMLDPL